MRKGTDRNMAAEGELIMECENVECVEVVYPPISETADTEVKAPVATPVQNTLIETNHKLHPYSLTPMSSDSAGLVLLSHLCELSAKQPLVATDNENNDSEDNIDNSSKINVIVERIQNDYSEAIIKDFNDRSASPMYNVVEPSPKNHTQEGFPSIVEVENQAKPKVSKPNVKRKRVTKTLKFPPCAVCSGNASGSHYGVNSCEACKGFFRRYLMRHEEYKCSKGGKCEIINRNRGNCSGCRLKKCLALGMAKEKSKLGRYTSARRTETIKAVNNLEGKGDYSEINALNGNEHAYSSSSDLLSKCISSSNTMSKECNEIVETLVRKLRDLKPFGSNIESKDQIEEAIKESYENYKVKTQLFGKMPAVPSDEFYKLYEEFGIDADGRMEMIEKFKPNIEGMIARYCDFAKHIPAFSQLSVKDQSNLLKTSRCDFFVTAMHHGYSEEYQMMLGKCGKAYHVEEAVDKFCSKKLVFLATDSYKRWQKLNLTDAELALICALTLVFTDRCTLENAELVERIQLQMVDLLQKQLAITCEETASRRFSKIIDNLTMMRESSELYNREYRELCKNKHLVEAIPFMTEFLVEEDE